MPQIAKWTESTMKKLKSQYISMLQEAGFINKLKGYIEITQPIIDKSIKDHLIEIRDETCLRAMIGEI
ncbi:DUF1819 family protein [Paraclostridium bifermentans]|nr:DUF1819 family protein [Paraclostridium bifermentans]